jgi:TolA-binding protein
MWVSFLTLLYTAGAATIAEKSAFNAARLDFDISYWERAENRLAEFGTNYPNSTLLPEARLLQGQARFKLGNYAGASELLTNNQSKAGRFADQYLYWLAQARFQQKEYGAAAEAFAKLANEFPQSPRRLEAALGEATSRARLSEWPRVIELLQKPDGIFQHAAKTNAADELVPRGYLLLGEAQAAQKDFRAAEATLAPLGTKLIPKLAWQWQYLMCRIQLADNRAEQALQSTTNLLAQAAGQPSLVAESISFRAKTLETLGRVEQAIDAYKENLTATSPVEYQRQALLKTTELHLSQNRVANAATNVEKFLAQFTNAPASDSTVPLARLTLGELRLRQHGLASQNAGPDKPADLVLATNCLVIARDALLNLTTNFPQSTFAPKAHLDLGWCFWLQSRTADAQKSFQVAAERLPASMDQATAYFKWADTQFQLQDFKGALTNYKAVAERYLTNAEVKTNLIELAYYQIVRAGLAAGDIPTATNALISILTSFPNSFRAERALLLTGQEISRKGNPNEARSLLQDFIQKAPAAEMIPEVHLAVARTYEQEAKWLEAIAQYENWLQIYSNNAARPRAEYYRGWANAQAHRETNTLTQFTNLMAQFPASEFIPHARWWVANYYFRSGNFKEAESNFQLLYNSTNVPPGELTCEAQMMAGRVAIAQQGWSDAIRYFLSLSTNANCPQDLAVQALFAYADTLVTMPDPAETNKIINYKEAIRVFQHICENYPTNKYVVLAWGQKANCYLQWAQISRQLEGDTNVMFGFTQVLQSPVADVSARSIASIGMAVFLEKQAQQKSGAEQTALLERAFNHYLDVFDGTILRAEEKPDVFWVKKAGLEAGRLAEVLQKWLPAKRIYERLRDVLPVYRARLDKNILRVQEHLR